MSGDRYNGLSDSEREAFRSIADGPVPGRELEDRTVTALRQHNLIRSRRGGILMKLSIAVGTVAAVAVIFMAGVTVGTRAGDTGDIAAVETAAPGENSYMLLLYMKNDPARAEQDTEMSGEAYLAIVEEYRSWGTRMQEAGRLVGAEKLKDEVLVLAAGGTMVENFAPGERVLGGYFLIRAKNLEHAHQLALSHPHLKYGGQVEIRPLDLHD